MHSRRYSRQSHARGEFGMVCRIEAQENQWRSCPGVQVPQTRPPVFRMLAQPEQDRQRIYHQVSRKRGVVVITGTVKKEFRKPDETGCRWTLSIHVRVSQPIRDYTSVAVNWTERTLAFTNEPSPIRRNATGKQTGIDRGCVHTLTLSDGTMLDMPQPSEREKREYLRLQRKLARQDMTNSRRGGKTAKFQSKRRKLTLKRMSSIRRRINNRKDDWVAKTTTRLVEDYDLIALEALDTRQMTRKPKPKHDPNHKGRYLRNGSAAKAGLNAVSSATVGRTSRTNSNTRHVSPGPSSYWSTRRTRPRPATVAAMSQRRTVRAKRSSDASTAAIRTMRTSTRPRTSSTARYTQPAWTMPRAWRDTHPVKPVFHGKVPLKRQPLPRVREDPSNEERVSYATGIPPASAVGRKSKCKYLPRTRGDKPTGE